MEFGKRVTVVDYDLTSGSDNDDRDDDQSYIYCSIARPLSPGNRLRHDGDAQQRSDSDDCPPEIKRARTEDDSSHSSTQSSESSCESASSCSDQEESDHSEPMPAAPPPVAISMVRTCLKVRLKKPRNASFVSIAHFILITIAVLLVTFSVIEKEKEKSERKERKMKILSRR